MDLERMTVNPNRCGHAKPKLLQYCPFHGTLGNDQPQLDEGRYTFGLAIQLQTSKPMPKPRRNWLQTIFSSLMI